MKEVVSFMGDQRHTIRREDGGLSGAETRQHRQYLSEKAGPGATFVIVDYYIRNEGKKTETVLTDDFEIVDSQGRRFSPSSDATTTYMMLSDNQDFIISQLQPGIAKATAQIFEVPTTELKAGLRLRIPEKGLLGAKEVFVDLSSK